MRAKPTRSASCRCSTSIPSMPRAASGARPTARQTATYVEIDTDDGTTGLFGPIFEETAPSSCASSRPTCRPGPARRRAALGRHVPPGPPRPQGLRDDGDQRGRLRALGPARQAVRAAGLPPARRPDPRPRVDCYASMLGHSLDPGLVRERAQAIVDAGLQGAEVVLPLRPERRPGGHGEERRAGPDGARGGRPEHRDHVRLLHGLGRDLHDPAAASGSRSTARAGWRSRSRPTASATSPRSGAPPACPIATGEHEYTRWGFLQLLQADAIDVIQADPDWCGGISELVKICTLASAYGRQVVPARPLDPRRRARDRRAVAGGLPDGRVPAASTGVQASAARAAVLAGEWRRSRLPETPGLGLTLDAARIDSRHDLPL